MNKNIKKITEIVEKTFSKEKAVLFCYLFGSTASAKTISTSDIDIAIYLDEKKCKDFFEKRLELIAKLSKELKKDVDVVILNTAPPLLKYVVLKEGKLIFERDESKKIDFELRSINEYFDFKPILDMYNKHLLSS